MADEKNNTNLSRRRFAKNSGYVAGGLVGGAGLHRNGQTWRFLPYDLEIKSKTDEKYGKDKLEKTICCKTGALPTMNWSLIFINLN